MKKVAGVLVLMVCTLPYQAWATGKSVHVRGYTRKDGTYVSPHTRTSPRTTFHGYSMPAAAFAGTVASSHRELNHRMLGDQASRGTGPVEYRTAYRTSAREVVATKPATPTRQFPVRDWHAQDGRIVGHGRMKYRAGDVLRIESEDGTWRDLDVLLLHPDDVQWLESARRDPNGMKTDVLPVEADETDDNGN